MKYLSTILSATAAFFLAAAPVQAQNPNHAPGDLVLFFQKEGGTETVYANLGNAANLFRRAAAGAQDGQNMVRFLDIGSELETAFGANWASDTGLYAGAAGVWGTSNTNTIALQNGDPHRTLYITRGRNAPGTIGTPDSTGWDLSLAGNSAMTTASTGIQSQNLVLETQYTTAIAVSPVSTSQIDDQNPFTAPGIQAPSMSSSLDGGIQQPGSATVFGAMGPAGSVEFALDLYRIVAINTVSGQVAGDPRVGSFEGTITVDSSGLVSFLAQPTLPSPEIDISAGTTNIISGSTTQDFGSLSTDSPALSQTFTITNNGNAELLNLAISKSGTHAGDFTVSNLSTNSLAASASTTFTVSFKPTAAGTRTAQISLANSDDDEDPFIIGLTGVGLVLKPSLAVTNSLGTPLQNGTSKLTYSSTQVGKSSASQIVILRNTGNANLTGLSARLTGAQAADFTVTGPTSVSLPAGASTTLIVVFKPKAAGARNAVLSIASNDATKNPFTLQLGGTGVSPAPKIDLQQPAKSSLTDNRSSKAFGTAKIRKNGRSLTFVIENKGTATLSGISVKVSGANPKDFVVTQPTKKSLAAGAKATFKVTFKPSALGNRKANLMVTSNDRARSPFDVALSGSGVR